MKIITRILMLLILFPLLPQAALAENPSREEQLQQLQALHAHLVRTYNLEDHDSLSQQELRTIIESGTEWILASQEEGGRFRYEYEPYDGHYLYGDNIVRQAGTLYALGEVLQHDPAQKDALQVGMKSAMDRFVSFTQPDTFLGVRFECFGAEGSDRCRLGAVSLALVAFISYVEAFPEEAAEYEDVIDAYARYIVGSKSLRTGFREGHNIGEKTQPSAQSPYADGEALLALVRYYQYKPDDTVKQVIDDTFEYIATLEPDSALYLWAMAALKDMQALWPNEDYVAYARDFTNWRVARVAKYNNSSSNYCSFVEGVASAYSVLEADSNAAERALLKRTIDIWNARNSTLQITDDNPYRYVQVDDELVLERVHDMSIARGGFLTSASTLTQRIDYTQHCVTAYLQTLVDIEGGSL